VAARIDGDRGSLAHFHSSKSGKSLSYSRGEPGWSFSVVVQSAFSTNDVNYRWARSEDRYFEFGC